MVDYLRLKAALLTAGVSAAPEALVGLGERFKEQNHGLFGWDFEDHVDSVLPDDFSLPDGTVVQFRQSSLSPYRVEVDGGRRVLLERGQEVCPVNWIERPAYYGRADSAGRPMVKTGQIGGADCLFFCYQNYCSHFSTGQQCLFCNLVATSRTYGSVLKKKDVESIGEVAAAAWPEGAVKHVLLTGGCFRAEREVDLVCDIIASIRRHTGLERVPGTVLPSPARQEAIRRYHDAGIGAIGYSMEIWDRRLYEAICPGKSSATSHNEFTRCIGDAVRVFGAGSVYAVFVMGLEPQDSVLEGVRAISEIGANVVPFVWSPNPGSRLAGHRAPTAEWFCETVQKAAEIVQEAGVPAGTENHCYRCDGNNMLHDALRLRGVT